ncbi:hypothetical protein [Streptomyces sp. NPDC005476]|uniref:hypothetical protein n=1 Tax=Streptomyces sp. NPDC005476 TaxID=3156882 RepID=UPI0034570F4D
MITERRNHDHQALCLFFFRGAQYDLIDTSDEGTSGGQDNGASGRTMGEAGLSSDGVRDET